MLNHRPQRCIALLLLCLSIGQTALADPATQTSGSEHGDYAYRFSDEDLLGGTLSEVGDMYRGRPKFARVLLLRPRTSLIQELLKSTEGL